ncbi:MAG: hypothetical protein H6Q56_1337 [Deltaproteobacteria bacterium]|nr:hypothetical protein [Deltaproteobacteria bacterium]
MSTGSTTTSSPGASRRGNSFTGSAAAVDTEKPTGMRRWAFLCDDQGLFLSQKLIHLFHNLEGIGNVEDISFPLGPAAAGIEVYGTPFVDETPADSVGFLAVAAGGQTLGVTRGRAGLSHLVQVAHEREYRLPFRRLVNQ